MKPIDNSFWFKLRVIMAHKDVLRNHCKPITNWYIKRFRRSQLQAAHKLKGKSCLEVAFFLSVPGMWKHDALFEAMRSNSRYHPYVVVFPYSTYKEYDKEELRRMLQRTYEFIVNKGYECVIPYDEKKRKWIDVKKVYSPDFVFFTSPYKDMIPDYYIYHYRDTLTGYLPYAFTSMNFYKVNYDLIFMNLVGLYFVETPLHKQFAEKYARNHGANTVVTGYPATEVFLDKNYHPKDLWKPQSHPKKRVIYAPHHSVDTDHNSTFLEYCDLIFDLADRYRDSIQFVFKPHQTLKVKLQQIWGVEKTEEYYQKWDELENTQLVNDGYEDLFLTSDALIHDSGSFTTEYLFVKKPVMYLCRNTEMKEKFNDFGQKSFECHYHWFSFDDINGFLREVVLKGEDPMKEQREQFYSDYLSPIDDTMPSRKILEVIEKTIEGD